MTVDHSFFISAPLKIWLICVILLHFVPLNHSSMSWMLMSVLSRPCLVVWTCRLWPRPLKGTAGPDPDCVTSADIQSITSEWPSQCKVPPHCCDCLTKCQLLIYSRSEDNTHTDPVGLNISQESQPVQISGDFVMFHWPLMIHFLEPFFFWLCGSTDTPCIKFWGWIHSVKSWIYGFITPY